MWEDVIECVSSKMSIVLGLQREMIRLTMAMSERSTYPLACGVRRHNPAYGCLWRT